MCLIKRKVYKSHTKPKDQNVWDEYIVRGMVSEKIYRFNWRHVEQIDKNKHFIYHAVLIYPANIEFNVSPTFELNQSPGKGDMSSFQAF
jgi:hypothetical protein